MEYARERSPKEDYIVDIVDYDGNDKGTNWRILITLYSFSGALSAHHIDCLLLCNTNCTQNLRVVVPERLSVGVIREDSLLFHCCFQLIAGFECVSLKEHVGRKFAQFPYVKRTQSSVSVGLWGFVQEELCEDERSGQTAIGRASKNGPSSRWILVGIFGRFSATVALQLFWTQVYRVGCFGFKSGNGKPFRLSWNLTTALRNPWSED